VVATVVRLLETSLIRVGNEEYARPLPHPALSLIPWLRSAGASC
jgi:hypothetical protein